MFKRLIVYCLIGLPIFGLAQTSSEVIQPIRNWISKYQDSGTIIYTDKIYEQLNNELFRALEKRKFKGDGKETAGHMLHLTRSERKYLRRMANSIQLYVWKDSLFSNSKRISADSMVTYLENYKMQFVRVFKDDSLNIEFRGIIAKDYKLPNVFMFSKPILFRNNTLCLFYIFWRCGHTCGTEEVLFYKKVNDSWVKWIVTYVAWI